MAIHSCKGCVPPKRTTTCKFDGTCNKYAEAKAAHDRLKAIHDRKRDINAAIYSAKGNKVEKALRDRRKFKR